MKILRLLFLSISLFSFSSAPAAAAGTVAVTGAILYTMTGVPSLLFGLVALPISQSDIAVEHRCSDNDPYSFCCSLQFEDSQVEPEDCEPQVGNTPICIDNLHAFCPFQGNTSNLVPAAVVDEPWKQGLTIGSSIALVYGTSWLVAASVYGACMLAHY